MKVATRSRRTMARCCAASRPRASQACCANETSRRPSNTQRGDRQYAVGLEVVQVLAERLGGVERVLGQGIGAGRRRRPGVDERRLDDVVFLTAAPHEAAAIVDVHRDPAVGVDAARVVTKPVLHDVAGDDRIDFDAVDVPRAEHQGRQQVPAAAWADDQRRGSRTDARPGGRRVRSARSEDSWHPPDDRCLSGSASRRRNRCP